MTAAELLNRADVKAVLAWADEAFEQAMELPEYRTRKGASDIEVYAASPTGWLGALEFKLLSRLGLTDAEVDAVLASR